MDWYSIRTGKEDGKKNCSFKNARFACTLSDRPWLSVLRIHTFEDIFRRARCECIMSLARDSLSCKTLMNVMCCSPVCSRSCYAWSLCFAWLICNHRTFGMLNFVHIHKLSSQSLAIDGTTSQIPHQCRYPRLMIADCINIAQCCV